MVFSRVSAFVLGIRSLYYTFFDTNDLILLAFHGPNRDAGLHMRPYATLGCGE